KRLEVELGDIFNDVMTKELPAAALKNFLKLLEHINEREEAQMRSEMVRLGMRSSADAYFYLRIFKVLGLVRSTDQPSAPEVALEQAKGLGSLIVEDAVMAINEKQ